MKVLQIHNMYRFRCGEETVFDTTVNLLEHKGIHVSVVTRDSRNLGESVFGKLRAFATGIYSPSAYKFIAGIIKRKKPDVVHVHNLYPLFSPSVLVACQQLDVPVVMTCHNFRLTCPTGTHLHNGAVCELCCGGREYWCVLKNCTGKIFESIGYALRTAVARKFRLFHNNVTLFIALTEFAKNRLIKAGLQEERIVVVPNMVSIPDSATDPSSGCYAAFAGLMYPEKGVDTLLEATALLPEMPVRLAGDGAIRIQLVQKAPKNAEFVGLLDRGRLAGFYRKARFIVVPSECFEMCPLVISEAMSHGLPVIASNIGGLPEIVEDGVTGLLFEPGNADELAKKMKLLWENPDLCRQMGKAGREKAIRDYSEDVYYKRLMAVYKSVIEINQK